MTPISKTGGNHGHPIPQGFAFSTAVEKAPSDIAPIGSSWRDLPIPLNSAF